MLAPKPVPVVRSFADLAGLLPPDLDYHYLEAAAEHPFRHQATSFEVLNAWWLAEMAFLAYIRDQNRIRQELARVRLPNVEYFGFDRGSTQCFVGHNEDFIVVSFRGTEATEFEDILTDLNAFPKSTGYGGSVHQGFWDALIQEGIWNRIEGHLRGIRHNQTVWFTGHSLGAALATIAADIYGNVQGLYTFGSPRVGDESFRADFNVPTYRVVNNRDAVTQLPSERHFQHVGAPKLFDEEGNLHDAPVEWSRAKGLFQFELGSLLSERGGLRIGFRNRGFAALLQPLADHAPANYTVKLWNHYLSTMWARSTGAGGVR